MIAHSMKIQVLPGPYPGSTFEKVDENQSIILNACSAINSLKQARAARHCNYFQGPHREIHLSKAVGKAVQAAK
jgi:hypothetical protein